ncbi:SUKH-4 family immunity protein [Streptomyces griseorubiginosus]|uniref:SUKH-4 family immunity protein n=1 Tax=Streptomyces griseorubiginosus TaxID=67304 RepID=UPI0036E21524
MVTFAQAQERAEEWINGDVPAYQHREVRVREFDLGFVVWAEDRADGPRSDGGAQRLVIARDSGEATLWPSLPVGEVIRRYEEEYGRDSGPTDAAPTPPARVDLNQTSFLLTPPEWLQDAADKLGIGGRGDGDSGADAEVAAGSGSSGGAGAASGARPWTGTDTNGGEDLSVALPDTVFSSPGNEVEDAVAPTPEVSDAVRGGSGGAGYGYPQTVGGAGAPASGGPGVGVSSPPPASGASSYGYPQGAGGAGAPGTPAPSGEANAGAGGVPAASPGASSYGYPQGAGGSGGPGTPAASGQAYGSPQTPGAPPASPGASSYGYPQGAGAGQLPGAPGAPAPAPSAGDIADLATSKLAPPGRGAQGGGSTPPPPPGAAGVPGAQPGSTPPAGGGYVPTQFVSAPGAEAPSGSGPGTGPTPPPPPGAQGFPGAPGGPAAPAFPGAPGVPGGPGSPGAPGAPGGPGSPDAPAAPHAPGGPGAAGGPGAPGGSGFPAAPNASGGPAFHGAPGGPGAAGGPAFPGTPGAPGTPGPPPPPGTPGPPPPPGAPGAPHPSGTPAAPQPPGAPGVPGGTRGAVHHAETVLSTPPPGAPGAAGVSAPPPPPGAVGAVAPPGAVPPPPGQAAAYGYPQQSQPTVGPGYQAVLRYRAQDGSEQQVIRRSAPGTPHPEWQIFHELRGMNVPPDQVLELHTELESCELPGAYCARMIREQWPQARITSIAPYGTDHASRQQGMRQLLAHQGELHQVADGPARPAPVRAPLPPVQAAPPVPPEGVAQELAAAFGPGVFRFEQIAVDRQGVPPVVAHSLVVAGLPLDMGPFFWAQAQPGRPVPTLAELAAERGVRPASDAGSYLVMGSDFGKAVCVQYGTANIVAVPVEAGPGGAPVPPQFVNTGLPEFQRCLALLGRMWRLRFGLNQEQAGRWTVDFQAQLASLDPAALSSPESWWSVLLEEMWDGLL